MTGLERTMNGQQRGWNDDWPTEMMRDGKELGLGIEWRTGRVQKG